MEPRFDIDEVSKIIVPMRKSGEDWNAIAKALNKAGLKTKSGKKWSAPNAALTGINQLGVPRVHYTSAGPAESSGGGQIAKRPKPKRRRRMGSAYAEIEDIMTSNLDPKLKLKLIGALVDV